MRMNKDRAREELRDRKILAEIEYNQSEDAKKKDNLLRYIQALDIAIESLSNAEIDNKIIKTQHDRIQELKDNEWVDVRDRLPSENGYYLVSIKGVRETTTWFYGISRYGNGWDEFEGHEDIIAWRPLPKPYERKE